MEVSVRFWSETFCVDDIFMREDGKSEVTLREIVIYPFTTLRDFLNKSALGTSRECRGSREIKKSELILRQLLH